MRIKKIVKINSFGCFQNFEWEKTVPGFCEYNFFYGWNYSGKTTLSKIFRCLEIKALHKDFPDAEFSLETDNANIIQRDISKDYPIRVFNENFVEDNFQWNNEEARIAPVLILGKEVQELKDKAKNLTKQRCEKEETHRKTKEDRERKERDLNNYLTDRASEIRNILGITNAREFDKSKLEEKIESIADSYESYILPEDKKVNTLDTYRSKKPEKITFKSPQLKLSTFISEVEDILSEKVTAQQIIEKLKENPELSDWVRAGIPLHKNEKECQFCGNELSPVRIEILKKHFSDEFDKLMEKIKNEEKEISDHFEEIKNLNLPDKARLFEVLQSQFENGLNSLKATKSNYIQTLKSVKEELKRKREKPFDSLEIQELSDNTLELTNALKEIESIINSHKSKVDSFVTEKQKAKDDLIKYFTAEFIKKKNYFGIKKEIETEKESIKKLEQEIGNLEKEIEDINNKIKAEAIGAVKINGYLKEFFNDDKLKIKLMDDGKYKLYRNKRIAKNLSTGEKNIISLIYFFAKLEETEFDFSNAVIFIDDPVSSLDSNHIFKVYAFVNEKLKDCGQLFITTHNFDFFNLLKDLSKYDLNNKGKFYLVKMSKSQTGEYSSIENLPKVLLNYKSEYNYLFSILKSFHDSNDKSNFELLYILPNILRRFFEAYLFMKYPDGRNFKKKAKRFLKDTNKSDIQKTLKLMDEYSHEKNPTHTKKFPDVEEVEDAIRFILKTIKDKDKEHYEALCDSLNANSN